VWVLIGTDSGFEGLTQLYYDKVTVDLTDISWYGILVYEIYTLRTNN